MERERKYRWFLEPQDSHTNAILSKELGEENMTHGVRCADDRRHTLFECTRQFLAYLEASKDNMGIHFNVFCQEGDGKIRNLTKIIKRRHARKARQAQTQTETAIH